MPSPRTGLRVVNVAPDAGASAVDVTAQIRLTFSEALAPDTATNDTIQITGDADAPVPGTLSYSGTTVTFKPSKRLTWSAITPSEYPRR